MRPDLAACYGQERLPRYTELSDRAAFLGRDRCRYLCRMAEGDSAVRPARRSICTCRSAARCAGIAAATPRSRAATSRSRSMQRRCAREIASGVAADRPPSQGRPHPFRRRHADDHDAGSVRRPDRRRCGIPSSCCPRPKSRSRSIRARLTARDGRRRSPSAASTAPALACRASIRSCSAPSTGCRASSRRPPRPKACAAPASPASISI